MASLLQKLQALSTRRVLFCHQSVGNNLMRGYPADGHGGFQGLFAANPAGGVTSAIAVGEENWGSITSNFAGWTPGEWFDCEIPSNLYPINKLNNFKWLMDQAAAAGVLPDFAALKLCFADINEATSAATLDSIWTTYYTTMDALEASYPGRVIYWTGALTYAPDLNQAQDNVNREEMNNRIRSRYGSTGRVFDFALMERTNPQGVQQSIGGIPFMALEWCGSGNGGTDAHPNDTFINRVGLAYVDLLYARTQVQAGSAMTAASRTSGVAPLAVFFDAADDTVGSSSPNTTFAWTSGVAQPTDKEGAHYSWDFGDPFAGTWSQTGKTRNTATGYTTAHVYETPGTYTAVLSLTDVAGTTSVYTQNITVTDFTGTTYYVSVAGSDSNDGLSEAAPFRTVHRGLSAMLAASGPVRCLFRRGDTFAWDYHQPHWVGGSLVDTAFSCQITKAGPGIVGAYGSGAKPIINCPNLTADSVSYGLLSPRGTGTDWRIMDLDMRGPGDTETGAAGPPPDIKATDSLFLRLSTSNWTNAIGWSWWAGVQTDPHDRMFIVECEITGADIALSYGLYVGGRRHAIMGNAIDHHLGGSHAIRFWQGYKGTVAHNRVTGPNVYRHSLKLHGVARTVTNPLTQWVTVTDNVFIPGPMTQISASIGPQGDSPDQVVEYVSHVLYERNQSVIPASATNSSQSVDIDAEYVVARNNTEHNPNAGIGTTFFYVWWRGRPYSDGPPAAHVRIYNNTSYSLNAGSTFVWTDAACSDIIARNNFAVYPNGGVLMGSTPAGLTHDHNLAVTSVAAVTNAAAGDFSLTAGSPAIDAGTTLADVREDFARATRLVPFDVGAYQYGSAGDPIPSGPTARSVTSTAGGRVQAVRLLVVAANGEVDVATLPLVVTLPADLGSYDFPLTCQGTAPAGMTVRIFNAGTMQQIGTATANGDGDWTATLSSV